jgi:sulfate transport system ATP-binding protein
MGMISVNGVSKHFGEFRALDTVSLEIAEGELVALLGPSGSGKTTLLRIIAGLEFPDSGEVYFAGRDAAGLSARDRSVGFVFQHYALFRHMTVSRNIGFGLRVRDRRTRPAPAEITRRVNNLLDLIQLRGMAERYPSQLSGGQRQRVALARALAIEPKILLLDEPFGALDAQVRKELRRWLRRLHDELRITGVFVTHDQEEALEVADRVVVMNHGKIEQIGPPDEIYDDPATPFVFQFLGNVNRLPCRVCGDRLLVGGIWLAITGRPGVENTEGTAFIRPHDFDMDELGEACGIEATVRHVVALGPVARIEATVDPGERIDVEITRESHARLRPVIGQRVLLAPRRIRLFLTDGWQGIVTLDRSFGGLSPVGVTSCNSSMVIPWATAG